MILAGCKQMVRMNDEESNIFLARPYLAAFSTVDRKGKPHVTSVWYLYSEGYFFHVIEKRSVKWRNLTHGSSIGICVHNNDDERTLSAYGNPRFLEPTDEDFDRLHWQLSRRYFESDLAAHKYLSDIDGLDLAGIIWKPERMVGFLTTDTTTRQENKC